MSFKNSYIFIHADISWPKSRSDRFLSCGKDGRIAMNFLSSGYRPIQYANNVAINSNSVNDTIIVSGFLHISIIVLQ